MATSDGLCECGCGQPAPVATQTKARWGHIAGQPMRFVRGHAMRGKSLSAEAREAIGAKHRGTKFSDEHRRRISEAQRGEKGPNWRGGRIEREGRMLLYVGRDHPMADVYGYAYEHRLVMARRLGRPLSKTEHVHHVDGDERNNVAANLVLVSRSQHTRIHNLIRRGMAPADACTTVLG